MLSIQTPTERHSGAPSLRSISSADSTDALHAPRACYRPRDVPGGAQAAAPWPYAAAPPVRRCACSWGARPSDDSAQCTTADPWPTACDRPEGLSSRLRVTRSGPRGTRESWPPPHRRTSTGRWRWSRKSRQESRLPRGLPDGREPPSAGRTRDRPPSDDRHTVTRPAAHPFGAPSPRAWRGRRPSRRPPRRPGAGRRARGGRRCRARCGVC